MEETGHKLQGVVLRLKRGEDLYDSIAEQSLKFPSKSLAIVTCVGSLSHCLIRLAEASPGVVPTKDIDGPMEIVSLVGTVVQGHPHIHICVADKCGVCTGGHLLKGSTIHTTAELVLLELGNTFGVSLTREPDSVTGYSELVVRDE